MNIQTYEMDDEKLELYLFGDTHFPRGKVKKFREMLDTIKRRKYAKAIGLGDWIEAIKPGDPRYNPEELAAEIQRNGGAINMVNEQWNIFEDDIKEIAEKGKILGLHAGNHEYQFMKRNNFNGLKPICNRYDINYLGFGFARWDFSFENESTKMLTFHGNGGGSSAGYYVKKLTDHAEILDGIDLIAEGHTHRLGIDVSTDRLHFDKKNNLEQSIQYRCACGSFLGNYDTKVATYSERAAYKPLPIGYIRVDIDGGTIKRVVPVPL